MCQTKDSSTAAAAAAAAAGDVPEAWGFMTATKYKLRCLNLAGMFNKRFVVCPESAA
jgi:hypothetical protein